jgi:DNA-binding winged helix-turn-helix (wHTH) protein
MALVERPGKLITKEELIARVWPDTFVEEASLRVHVAALRKALGDGQLGNRYVVNVAGRGYRFVAPVQQQEALDEQPHALDHTHNLPAPLTRTIGRADIIGALTARLQERRFVTLVGPGGIGKTTVALAVAHNLLSAYAHGVRLVDLASLKDPTLLPGALASALGLAIRSRSAGTRLDRLSARQADVDHSRQLRACCRGGGGTGGTGVQRRARHTYSGNQS